MLTANEIQNSLGHFIGTETYTRWSVLFRNALLTDGAKYVAEKCGEGGAYWLMDMIMSHAPSVDEFPAYAKLKVAPDNSAVFTLTGYKSKVTQKLEYTDFPITEISLVLGFDGEHYIICLSSEN